MRAHHVSTRSRFSRAILITLGGLAGCTSPDRPASEQLTERQSALTNPLPNATGDPQLFGFGYPQLAIIDGTNLQVLAPPARVQDAPWTTRWLSPMSAAPPVIVAGDFWHASDGKAYLLAIKSGAVTTYGAPEIPSAATWAAIGTAKTLPSLPAETVLDATSGDFLALGHDQLVVLTTGHVVIYSPATTVAGAWTLSSSTTVPTASTGIAAGEFWSGTSDDEEMRYRSGYLRDMNEQSLFDQGIGHGPRGKDTLCLLRSDGKLGFYNWVANAWSSYRTSANTVSGKIAAGDFLRHGREEVAVVSTGATKTISVYDAPPANNANAALLMSANITDRVPSTITDITADRLFGYVDQTVSPGARRGTIPTTGSDVEIAFMERTPIYQREVGAPNYGWPASGEAVTYTVYLKNNGPTTIPANTVTVKFWLNRTGRNADVLAPTTPDDSKLVTVPIPAFDPTKPFAQRYVPVAAKTFAWPYSLIDDVTGGWKKLNVGTVGERWTIASVSGGTDLTVRNNRDEAALHAWMLHPIYQTNANLADRQPTIGGDPASKEYLTRKLGDFIGVAWARSTAGDKSGADIRLIYDGYLVRSEFPPDQAAQLQENAWLTWEGPRDLQDWFGSAWEIGKYCSWEGDEMHETGHLFHQLGDLYQYFVEPSLTGSLKLADGRIPQFRTWVWSNQEHANNCNVFSENDVLTHTHVVGMRNVGREPNATHLGWDRVLPKKVFVKIVDRNGNPIANANVGLWRQNDTAVFHSGTTDATGTWDTGHPYGEVPTLVGTSLEPHYTSPDGLAGNGTALFVTVDVNGYRDAAPLGSEGHRSLGLYTTLGAYHVNPDSYTWTFKTNYAPSAAAFTAPVTAAVAGGTTNINVGAGGTYRLYRQLPPTYERVRIGADVTGATSVTLSDNLSATDGVVNAFNRPPGRALYEITSVSGGAESLPAQLAIQQVSHMFGVTDLGAGKLLVGNKLDGGTTSTFLSIFAGTTPQREYVYHYRWGHTAMKAVPSALGADRLYVALQNADATDQFSSHLVEVYQPMAGVYAAWGPMSVSDIPFIDLSADSLTAHSLTKSGVDFVALGINVGDHLNIQDHDATITAVTTTQITIGSDLLDPLGSLHFFVYMNAGTFGDVLAQRQVRSVRGLEVLNDATTAKEHVAIADPDGQRVVFWNDKTKYVAQYTAAGFTPTGLARHPLKNGVVFVLDCSATTRLVQLRLASGTVTVDAAQNLPASLPASDGTEIGLTAVASGTDVLLAAVDAADNRIVEYKLTAAGALTQVAQYTSALAPFVGSAALSAPRDVAYTVSGTTRSLFASDGGGNRLVLIASASTGGSSGSGGSGGVGRLGRWRRGGSGRQWRLGRWWRGGPGRQRWLGRRQRQWRVGGGRRSRRRGRRVRTQDPVSDRGLGRGRQPDQARREHREHGAAPLSRSPSSRSATGTRTRAASRRPRTATGPRSTARTSPARSWPSRRCAPTLTPTWRSPSPPGRAASTRGRRPARSSSG